MSFGHVSRGAQPSLQVLCWIGCLLFFPRSRCVAPIASECHQAKDAAVFQERSMPQTEACRDAGGRMGCQSISSLTSSQDRGTRRTTLAPASDWRIAAAVPESCCRCGGRSNTIMITTLAAGLQTCHAFASEWLRSFWFQGVGGEMHQQWRQARQSEGQLTHSRPRYHLKVMLAWRNLDRACRRGPRGFLELDCFALVPPPATLASINAVLCNITRKWMRTLQFEAEVSHADQDSAL